VGGQVVPGSAAARGGPRPRISIFLLKSIEFGNPRGSYVEGISESWVDAIPGFLHGPESFGNLAEFSRVGILHMFV